MTTWHSQGDTYSRLLHIHTQKIHIASSLTASIWTSSELRMGLKILQSFFINLRILKDSLGGRYLWHYVSQLKKQIVDTSFGYEDVLMILNQCAYVCLKGVCIASFSCRQLDFSIRRGRELRWFWAYSKSYGHALVPKNVSNVEVTTKVHLTHPNFYTDKVS